MRISFIRVQTSLYKSNKFSKYHSKSVTYSRMKIWQNVPRWLRRKVLCFFSLRNWTENKIFFLSHPSDILNLIIFFSDVKSELNFIEQKKFYKIICKQTRFINCHKIMLHIRLGPFVYDKVTFQLWERYFADDF
jgi:hypothetical protein